MSSPMPEKVVSFHASRKDALKDYRVFERKLLLAVVDLLILLLAFYATHSLSSGISDGIGKIVLAVFCEG